MNPIRINLTPWMCQELSTCEEGSYSDNFNLVLEGKTPERDVTAHAHVVAFRHARAGLLVIATPAEALDMYYAVCSGVFKAKTPATYRAACRIANLLREHARAVDPGLVCEWPEPLQEQFTGV